MQLHSAKPPRTKRDRDLTFPPFRAERSVSTATGDDHSSHFQIRVRDPRRRDHNVGGRRRWPRREADGSQRHSHSTRRPGRAALYAGPLEGLFAKSLFRSRSRRGGEIPRGAVLGNPALPSGLREYAWRATGSAFRKLPWPEVLIPPAPILATWCSTSLSTPPGNC